MAELLRKKAGKIPELLAREGALTALPFASSDIVESVRAAASRGIPLALRALEADDTERGQLLEQLSAEIRETRVANLPPIVDTGLLRMGLLAARGILRSEPSGTYGFTSEELEAEFAVFEDAFLETFLRRGRGQQISD